MHLANSKEGERPAPPPPPQGPIRSPLPAIGLILSQAPRSRHPRFKVPVLSDVEGMTTVITAVIGHRCGLINWEAGRRREKGVPPRTRCLLVTNDPRGRKKDRSVTIKHRLNSP